MGFTTSTTSADTEGTNTRERLLLPRVTPLRITNLVYNEGHPSTNLNAPARTKGVPQEERRVIRILLGIAQLAFKPRIILLPLLKGHLNLLPVNKLTQCVGHGLWRKHIKRPTME